MSDQERLRPWAERERPVGFGLQQEDEAAALFRRVDVAVRFDPQRVALAVLARRSAGSTVRMRFAVVGAAAAVLLGSAGAIAAVRRMPRLGLWLLTVSSSHPPRARSEDLPPPERALPPAPPESMPAIVVEPPPVAPVLASETPARRHAGVHKRTRRLAMHRQPGSARASRALEAVAEPPDVETFALAPAAGTGAPATPDLSALGLLGLPPASPGTGSEPAATAPAAAPESQLARETRLLNQAYSQLRSDDDPAAALDSLDEYLNVHPLGLLRKEASSARVEALIKLRRRNDALAVLRSFPFGEGARDAELRVLRGELTAAHDCESAIRDFVAVSDKVAPPPILDRALYGRAACEARLGQRAQAAASFRAYLRQFPDGNFAAEAKRQVGETAK